MPSRPGTAARIATVVALGIAVFLVAYLLLSRGDSYEVTAEFENASQLVKGNEVKVGGYAVGKVEKIMLGDDGTALVRFTVDDDYAPLHEGTVATIRSDSLATIAGRYIELTTPPDGTGNAIADGGTLGRSQTVSEVDVDQLFNTFSASTINDLKRVIRGFASAYAGRAGQQANRSFRYLSPFLSTSRRLAEEVGRDRHSLERFVVDSADLSHTLAGRSKDTALLVSNLDRMMGAIGSRSADLQAAVGELPPFMREFNTTSVNLRAALDDLTPLVEEATPAARALRPFMRNLRRFSARAVPAIGDLRAAVRRPGATNDLIELTRLQPAIRAIGVGPVHRNGAERRGALPESTQALVDSLPVISFLRPYLTIEGVSGWFNTFSHPGYLDANGGIGRIANAITPFGALPNGIPNLLDPLTPQEAKDALSLDNRARCPGANERDPGDGSIPFTDNGTLDCDPTETAVGP